MPNAPDVEGLSEIEAIIAGLNQLDSDYVSFLNERALALLRLGVYGQVAALLPLRKGDTHVDLGSGTGILCKHLKEKSPRSAVVGVDSNKWMHQAVHDALSRDGTPHMVYANGNESIQDGALRTEYVIDEDAIKEGDLIIQPTNPVTFVGDDITTLEVLRYLLDGRKLDSASYVLSGASQSAVYRSPYRLDQAKDVSDPQVFATRMMESHQATRLGAWRFATQSVKPGGAFVFADQCTTVGPREEQRTASFMHNDNLSGMLAYWELESEHLMGGLPSSGKSEPMCMPRHSREAMPLPGEIRKHCLVSKFRRNSNPFAEVSA